MSGGLVKNSNKISKNEMRVKEPSNKSPHAYGEGGPEKQSGHEGPTSLPGGKED